MSAETRSAVEAFDAMRGELAGVRTDVAALARKMPDYAPTLGDIVERLERLHSLVKEIGASAQPRTLRLPGEPNLEFLELYQLAKDAKDITDATGDLQVIAGEVVAKQDVRRQVKNAGITGAVIGLVLSLAIAFLSAHWVGERAVGSVVGGDPWMAGQMLMEETDPVSFWRMVELYRACPKNSPTKLCVTAMALGEAAAIKVVGPVKTAPHPAETLTEIPVPR